MPTPAVMWFRQDLRLADNAALKAAAEAGPLICVYVLDDATAGDWAWGGASRWWLHNSLIRLAEGLSRFKVPLVLKRGPADKVIAEILREIGAASLHFTRDYAPWSGALEQRIKSIATDAGAGCHRYGGFLLHEPEAIRTGQGQPYKVFTPFSRTCFALGDPRPPRPAPKTLKPWEGKIKSDRLENWRLLPRRPDWSTGFAIWTPGEQGARQRLENLHRRCLVRLRGRPRPAGSRSHFAPVTASPLGRDQPGPVLDRDPQRHGRRPWPPRPAG